MTELETDVANLKKAVSNLNKVMAGQIQFFQKMMKDNQVETAEAEDGAVQGD